MSDKKAVKKSGKNPTQAQLRGLLKHGTSKERNKAIKLLKQFESKPNNDYDDTAKKSDMHVKSSAFHRAFICFRCDKVKQCQVKVSWATSDGNKTICHGCYTQLASREDINKMRIANQKAGLIPQGFGLGLTHSDIK